MKIAEAFPLQSVYMELQRFSFREVTIKNFVATTLKHTCIVLHRRSVKNDFLVMKFETYMRVSEHQTILDENNRPRLRQCRVWIE